MSASGIRIDKWLWAARFFRSRSLAKAAIEGGKVHHQGQRVKVSKEVHVGMLLLVRQSDDEREIEILGLSDVRGPASQAQTLYQETELSCQRREHRRVERLSLPQPSSHRPDKHERRQIIRFREC